MVIASVQQVQMALQKWAVENGQARGDNMSWNLNTVPRGTTVAQAALFNAWQPSPFDRWQMTWSGLRQITPHVAARIVGTAQPLQSNVVFSAKMPLHTAEEKAEAERLLQSMEDAINNAAKLDVKKPLDEQISKRVGNPASRDISGWWLFAGVIGLSIAWAMVRHGSRGIGGQPIPVTVSAFRSENWWLSRSPRVQQLMNWTLGIAVVLSVIAFLSFDVKFTQTADHSGVSRNLRDVTIGLGDPWFYILHHQTGTRGGFKSGVNLFAGSALFGYAAIFGILASLRLSREQKRRKALPDVSTDMPQRKFFWSAVSCVALCIAGVIGVVVHQARIDLGPRWADAKQAHPDFTRPGSISLALKKAIADELKLTPEQLEKVNAALNRAQLDFLKLENDHSLFRSVRGRLVKEVRPFPDRSFDLAQRLGKELRDIAGQDIIDTPVRGEVWKLRLFGHAGEFNVRAEIWQENGNFHVEDVWERDGEKITSKSGDGFADLRVISDGAYVLDWESMKDILHESKPDDETTGFTKGWDTMQVFIDLVRLDELSQMLALDPKTVRTAANPRAALITQAGTELGRSLTETQLKLHGIPFAKDATPEFLVTKLEALLGKPTP
jgi:hypothetical protein